MRDRLDLALRDFVTDDEKSSFKTKLEGEESWLYDEGFDETKQEYEKRLDGLKEIGDRYVS